MNKSTYDSRIIILDVDFLEINRYSLDDSLFAKKLLLELAANQNLIFITDNNFNDAYKVLNNLGIKTGFLITNSGASITSIADKKIILETMMDKDVCTRVTNECIWSNLNFSINTKNFTFPYRMINNWIMKKYKSDLSYLYDHSERELQTTEDIKKCISENEIRGLEIYFLENDDEIRKKQMMDKMLKLSSFKEISFVINSSVLYVVPTIISKFKVVEYLANKMGWDLKNNGLYCGIGQCATEICQNVYFPVVTKEAISKKDHKPFQDNSSIEEIPRGSTAWVSWFYKNAHLWSGEEEKLKMVLTKNKNSFVNMQNIEDLKKGATKFLEINIIGENFKNKKNNKLNKLFFKSKFKDNKNNENIIQIGFWQNQISYITKLINSNQLTIKKT